MNNLYHKTVFKDKAIELLEAKRGKKLSEEQADIIIEMVNQINIK